MTTPKAPHIRPRTIALLAFDGAEILDIAGPASVFAMAGEQVVVGSVHGGDVTTSAGVVLGGTLSLAALAALPLDTVLVAGGEASALTQAVVDGVPEWLAAQAVRVRRLGSVCTGAFLLAAAGLLDGKRAITHWNAAAVLQRAFPAVRVDASAVYVVDGNVCTSAGVSTGIDLALALVEHDHGRALAATVARQLVVFVRRPQAQAQQSAALRAQAQASRTTADLCAAIVDDLDGDLRVPALARRAGMSERNFTRVFTSETGVSPARYVAQVRLERACALLQDSDASLEQVATAAGFGSIDALQRAFQKHLQTTPTAWRAQQR